MQRDMTPTSAAHIFTVDVEEYFQVHAFEGVVRRQEWAGMPSRVCENVDRLLDLLAENDEITKHVDRDALATLLDPANYLGQSGVMVDRVLATLR
jgi:adenylosuccinate lyase